MLKLKNNDKRKGRFVVENKDYNNPYGDYSAPEESPVTYTEKPYYETAEEYNQAHRATSEGKPMKSYFAVQLVFAIVEMLLCCFSPITMILAIIALVFAIQANTAYTYGKEIDFKVKSKVSSILLIIGGVFTAISIITSVLFTAVFATAFEGVIHEIEQEFDGDLSGFMDGFENGMMEEYYSGEYLGNGSVPLSEGYEVFSLNGVEYALPMTYEEFSQMGFTLEEGYEGVIVEPGGYENFIINDDSGYMAGMARVSNHTNVVLSLEECMLDFISFENKAAYDETEKGVDLVFLNGLTMNSSYEEIEAFLGPPTYQYIDIDGNERYENFTWYYSSEDLYQCVDVSFSDGVISNISFEYDEY